MTLIGRLEKSANANEMTFPLDVYQLLMVISVLRAAIVKTLEDNGHLADGEDCTLSALKRALRDVEMPWEGDKEV